ncbi:hypothetical protein JOQ06_028433 [Pogonophryne albipinna]|uniref:Uncharacterized protein n=1 Tax=Pogonophryne albipinna TaxID=1090488 RepID=A0AAD6FKP2_9TELE|nr:hypothetical protein JOQ06_028433 [Pogonophryne albipinna]
MDYSRDSKEGKPPTSTEERLDSGLDSLKEEEYQAVTAEIRRLQLECEPPQHKQDVTGELQEWKIQLTEDGDTVGYQVSSDTTCASMKRWFHWGTTLVLRPL